MQTQFEALGQRRMKVMPIFNVQRAHVRMDTRTLVTLFKNLFPEDRLVMEVATWSEHRDPDLDFPEKPPSVLKKNCTAEEWEQYNALKLDHQARIEAIKASDKYINARAENDAFVAAYKAVAASFFRKLPRKNGWRFDSSIMTDGISISLQYSKSAQEPVAKKTKKKTMAAALVVPVVEEYDRHMQTYCPDQNTLVVGVDPGRTNMACVTYEWDGKSKSWSLTRGAYYTQSGIKKAKRLQDKRVASLKERWSGLGTGGGSAVATSKSFELVEYMTRYAAFSEEWWGVALKRIESRDNLKRYMGKRKVMDTFWASIQRSLKKAFPTVKVQLAYGSAAMTMKPTGPGEVAVPTAGMYASCERVFKAAVVITDEKFSTAVEWESGKRKELSYKDLYFDGDGYLCERLKHTTAKTPPKVALTDVQAVAMYNEKKRIQGKHRRGGDDITSMPAPTANKILRYPEVRGLRFSPEQRKHLDRDRQAALTIARLRCMELRGLGRPSAFAHSLV
jgi:hypothetical protein